MVLPNPDLTQRSHDALENTILQGALKAATTTFIERRRHAITSVADWESLRQRARKVKEHTINNLDYYLGQVVEKVEAHGGKVYWARTGDDVSRYIIELARARGVKSVVKSKSMATEEIELNEALEAAGVKPVETDLGEYIIQLAHEKPSHIIAPAIHKTKGQVADLFSKELGGRFEADPEVLTAVARTELRQKFLEADMGITGANFAVAETGTVVLVTNEGNGRMVTSLPRIHVAVMGMEKVIPSMTDLMVFLAILARSATGQKLSSYTTLVRGPRQPGEMEGPEEFHLILMDNGRTRQIAGTLREALYCLRCGACLNVCPVYRQIGGHAYGHTYPGPIGILLTAMLRGDESVKELAHASSLCGACKDVCPVRIDIPRMLIELREHLAREKIAPWTERLLFGMARRMMMRPSWFRRGASVARLAQKPFARAGRLRALPLFFGKWTGTRDLPPVAPRTFRERWKDLQ